MKVLRSHRWLAALAAILLLVGTAAPALVRMDCLSSGHTVVSIGQAEDCCPPDQDHQKGPQIHAICCEFQRTVPERMAFHVETAPSAVAAFERASEPRTDPAPCLLDATKSYGLMAHPPPLLTAERLSQVGSFLI
jgi:hypothetical protein